MRVACNISIVGIRLVIGAALSLFIAATIADRLGTEGNGEYTLAISMAMIASALGSVGLGPASVYFLHDSRFKSHEILAKNLAVGVLAAFAAYAIAATLAFSTFQGSNEQLDQNIHFLVLTGIFPLILNSYILAMVQARSDFSSHGFLSMIPNLLLAGVLLSGISIWTVKQMTLLWVAAQWISFGLGLLHLRQDLMACLEGIRIRSGYIFEALCFGFVSYVGNILTMLNYRADYFLLAKLSDNQNVGVYAVTVPITESIWMISNAAAIVILPLVSQTHRTSNHLVTPFVTRWVGIFSLLLAGCVGTLSYPIVLFFFGQEYEAAGSLIRFLLPGVTAWSIARVLCNDLAGRGYPQVNLWISLAALITNIISNFALIPIWGAHGAAVASSISYGTLTLLTAVVYTRIVKVRWWSLFIPELNDWSLFRSNAALYMRAVQRCFK